MSKATLFFDEAGPHVYWRGRHRDGTFVAETLNPERQVAWAMTRGELFRMGWRCIKAAIRG